MSFILPAGLLGEDREPSVIEKLWAGRVLDLRREAEWRFRASDGRELIVSSPGWQPVEPPALTDHLRLSAV